MRIEEREGGWVFMGLLYKPFVYVNIYTISNKQLHEKKTHIHTNTRYIASKENIAKGSWMFACQRCGWNACTGRVSLRASRTRRLATVVHNTRGTIKNIHGVKINLNLSKRPPLTAWCGNRNEWSGKRRKKSRQKEREKREMT